MGGVDSWTTSMEDCIIINYFTLVIWCKYSFDIRDGLWMETHFVLVSKSFLKPKRTQTRGTGILFNVYN